MKKKALSLLLALGLCALCAGCTQPDALTLDLSHGYGQHTQLIHLNASSSQKAQRLEGFYQVLEDAEPLDKEFSLFTYYPDYLLELNRNGQTTTAYVDVNGQYIDFYYEGEEQLYRSHTTAEEFRQLVHQN